MGLVVPKVRKPLCADALLRSVQDVFCQITDHRTGGPKIPLRDALMSAFAMFSLQAPSLLAFDKERTEDNLQRVYGIGRVPCDTSMRETLDPLQPEYLRPALKVGFRGLQRGNVLEEMVFVAGHYLLALDGTGYYSSKEIHCESCLETHHKNGTITYAHQMLGAALIHPDRREVIPLMPEPIVKQDGSEKNDCERNAAKRFVSKFRQDHPHLKVIVTEDSLSSNAPHIETLQAHNMRYLLGVKERDHAFLFEQVAQAERAGRVTYDDRDDPKANVQHRFRFVSNLPLNASHPDLRVNFIECWETTADGKVQHFSWITDLCVNKGTVYQLMRGARARWRIENETFNTLKNQGYHFEHNFGPGYQHLSVVFATLMMLAFLVDQIQQLGCPLFQAAWAKWGSKRRLWEKMRAYFYIYALESMRHLFEALCEDLHKPAPTLASNAC
jgi:Transposase DDE domain